MVDPRRRPAPPTDQPPEPRMIGYRQQVDAVVEQATRELPETTGVRVIGRVGAVPGLVVGATPAQVRRLSTRPEVAGLFLYEPRGIDNLDKSMKIARADSTVTSGFKGTDVKVALWERGPDVLTDLRVEAFFDTTQTNKSSHARLTTAVIKNRQSSGPNGYAPDAKIFSANSYDIKALNWAIVTQGCSVINQSFHRDSEETDGALSAEDLIKDYYATHYPFPTIVHASGNQSTTGVEFVNHKGYNALVVGNHNDAANRMDGSSVFKNPTSPHSDRELPDVSANGDNVTAAGLTMSGTSFASPAVAGSVAVIQHVAPRLKVWPEGCRAVIMAGAGRNVAGKTWWDDSRRRVEGTDGVGALDTRESVRIARAPSARNGAAAHRGWDVGTVRTADFGANGRSTFKYQVKVPVGGSVEEDHSRRTGVEQQGNLRQRHDADPANQECGLDAHHRSGSSPLRRQLDSWTGAAASTTVTRSSTFRACGNDLRHRHSPMVRQRLGVVRHRLDGFLVVDRGVTNAATRSMTRNIATSPTRSTAPSRLEVRRRLVTWNARVNSKGRRPSGSGWPTWPWLLPLHCWPCLLWRSRQLPPPSPASSLTPILAPRSRMPRCRRAPLACRPMPPVASRCWSKADA